MMFLTVTKDDVMRYFANCPEFKKVNGYKNMRVDVYIYSIDRSRKCSGRFVFILRQRLFALWRMTKMSRAMFKKELP